MSGRYYKNPWRVARTALFEFLFRDHADDQEIVNLLALASSEYREKNLERRARALNLDMDAFHRYDALTPYGEIPVLDTRELHVVANAVLNWRKATSDWRGMLSAGRLDDLDTFANQYAANVRANGAAARAASMSIAGARIGMMILASPQVLEPQWADLIRDATEPDIHRLFVR